MWRVQPFALWDAIVNNDDICFEHILPRLNGTDVKFLYGVNSETRALIMRSSRKEELRRSFYVAEMSSTSTLDIAWENRWLWQGELDCETEFCGRVARTNKLELLKWIQEEKECEWDEYTIYMVAEQGNLEMLKYCTANNYQYFTYEDACERAANSGSLECLKYLREEVEAPWGFETAEQAAANGHLHILEYLVERKYDKYNIWACRLAAKNGHLDCLKYLRETAKAPWNSSAVRNAHENNHPECLQYLLDNNCPLPPGWRYEHGTLHTS